MRQRIVRGLDIIETRPAAVLAAVVAASVLLQLVAALRHGFWYDEWITWRLTQGTFAEMLANRRYIGHTPGYFALVWGWTRLFGDSEAVMRLPSIACAAAAVVLLYLLVRRLTGPAVGLAAAALFALSPFLLYLGPQARMGTMALAFVLAAAYGVVSAEQGGRGMGWRAAGVAAACWAAMMAYWPAVLGIAAVAVYVVARPRPAWRMACGIGLGVLAFAPVAYWIHTGKDGGVAPGWMTARPDDLLRLVVKPFVQAGMARGPAATQWAAAGLVVAGAALGAWRLGWRGRLLVLLWLGPAVLLLLAGQRVLLSTDRYFAVSLAAAAGLMAAGLLGGRGRRTRAAGWIVYALVLAVELGGGLTNVVYGRTPPWRQWAAVVADRAGEDEAVVFAAGDRLSLWLHYYDGQTYAANRPDLPPIRRGGGGEGYTRLDAAPPGVVTLDLPPGVRGVWVIRCPWGIGETAEAVLDDLRTRFPDHARVDVRYRGIEHLRE